MTPIASTDSRQLRRFGIGLAALLIAVFVLIGPWLLGRSRPVWPWWIAGVLVSVALIWPRGLYPVQAAWLPVARLLAWINTHVLLGALFFLLVWPFGIYARLARKLHYDVGFDPESSTYKIPRESSRPVTDLTKPY